MQNAADAALAAGVPGRVLARTHGDELRVANTGAPLDAAGVGALAALRASAKRDAAGATGRFGVGFAAVLAVSTEPRLVTAAGGVAFSASATAREVAALGGAAAAELDRDPRVPVLRLVWPTDEEAPPQGYATEVRLPAAGRADDLLAELAGAAGDLLLALPALDRIEAGGAVVSRTALPGGRVRISGPDGTRGYLLADDGAVRWALPCDGSGDPDPYGPDAGEVLHAPTAAAEALSLPARLFAPFPLDPDRRRIRADDPAVDGVVTRAAAAYTGLVGAVPPAHRVRLVPEPGFPRSPLDGLLREAIGAALARTPWLPAAAPAAGDLAPAGAEWLDVDADGLPEHLAAADPGFARLVASGVTPPAGLEVDRLGPAGLAERLTGVGAPPSWWRELYALLAPAVDAVPGLAAELGALPVPLADGRLTPGPAGVLLPGADTPPIPELRIAHPDAVHPLLRRLGATDADPAALLDAPALHELVARSLDDADAGLDTAPLARAVLALLDTPSAVRRDWAGALALTDDEGLPARADELVLPDARIAPLLDPDAPVATLGGPWLPGGEHGATRDALVAAGVLDRFVVEEDGEPAVRDLDLVADDAWPSALAVLAADRDTRAAVLGGDTASWLSRHARIGGRLPATWRLRSAGGLAGLYDPVPELPGVDEAVLAAIGVRAAPGVADADEAVELLDRLGDPDRAVTGEVAAAAYGALAAAVVDGTLDLDDLDPPRRVRTPAGRVAAAQEAVVLDAPWVLPVIGDTPVVAGGDDPDALADLLDLPTASDRVTGTVRGTGGPVAWTALPEIVLACRALGVAVPDGDLVVHDRLVVDLADGTSAPVPTWPGTDGRWHASDPLRALVAALSGQARARMAP